MWATSTTNLNDKLIRLQQVLEITGLCKSVAYKLIKQGEFPAQITVGTCGARWSERAVRRWVADKVAKATAKAHGEPLLTVTAESNVPWPSMPAKEA